MTRKTCSGVGFHAPTEQRVYTHMSTFCLFLWMPSMERLAVEGEEDASVIIRRGLSPRRRLCLTASWVWNVRMRSGV